MRRLGLTLLASLLSASVAAADVSARAGVILVPNDDTIAPLTRSFELAGKSITFTRTGPSSFSSITGPLILDGERGTRLSLDPATLSATYSIQGFDFPFFESARRTLHISRLMGIYFEPPPPAARFAQFTEADLLLADTPVIAPFLTTLPVQTNFLPPEVFLKEMDDRLVVTWYQERRDVEVQAVLFRSGDIRFSYRSIGHMRAGAVYITSGNEPWRTLETVASGTDPVSDFATSNPPEIAAMLDITSVSLSRIGETNVLRFVIRTRNPIDRSKLGPDRTIGLNIRLTSSAFISAQISGVSPAGDSLNAPYLSVNGQTSLMRVEGDSITLTLAQEYALLQSPSDHQLTVSLANERGGDSMSLAGRIETAPRPARTDFAKVGTVASFPGPISDTFTRSVSNAFAVWEKARTFFNLDPGSIDGFAVYQNFSTIGVPAASVGNAGVDNIAIGSSISSTLPREPNVMDMHAIRDLWNASDENAASLLLHEFGHRWLFFIEHLENGVATRVLNENGHPALGMDTRAAFPVLQPFDCSAMGGSTYTDNGDGTFSGPPDSCGAAYSWLDLYLMGLAAPEEVPDVFYLTDTDPPIDELGFVEGQTLQATRKNVAIADVIARMGVRSPAYPASQREFKVLFALVYDPARPLPMEDVELVAHYASLFRERFSLATGGRGSIDTTLPVAERRRPARR